MEIRMKIWLEKDGQNLMGEGRIMLLRTIDETGSINAASEKLGISFRHAWGQLKKLEKRLGMRLLESRTGGKGGGGSKLTPEARQLLDEFDALNKDIHNYVRKKFSRAKLMKNI